MPEFVRPHHRWVAEVLQRMDAAFLASACCYFAGGTMLSMSFGEYRESRDIDFLCSSPQGFRAVREAITNASLGRIFARPVALAREVRADRDGIRTFLELRDTPIKFELVREARIQLEGHMNRALGVPVLGMESAVAEKLLANADRGLDVSTLSRDLVDLAFLALRAEPSVFEHAVAIAEEAYGSAVRRGLSSSLAAFGKQSQRVRAQLQSLGVDDTQTLRRGIAVLQRYASE